MNLRGRTMRPMRGPWYIRCWKRVTRGLGRRTVRRLLVVTAHPDDEAGGFGGTLLLSHERGIETYVICLTPGQAASNRGGTKSDEELSAMRRAEFARSCELLKVTRGDVMDYRDAALDKAEFLKVVGDLTQRVREIRP